MVLLCRGKCSVYWIMNTSHWNKALLRSVLDSVLCPSCSTFSLLHTSEKKDVNVHWWFTRIFLAACEQLASGSVRWCCLNLDHRGPRGRLQGNQEVWYFRDSVLRSFNTRVRGAISFVPAFCLSNWHRKDESVLIIVAKHRGLYAAAQGQLRREWWWER